MFKPFVFLVLLLVHFTSFASANRDNQNARILAGVEAVGNENPANSLALSIRGTRSLFNKETAHVMSDFFSAAEPSTLKTRNLIYLFGGPDVLFSQMLFPNFENMLLIGLETPGVLPDALNLDSKTRLNKISAIATAYANSLRNSYFITRDMGRELAVFGTTTMIATGLAIQGFEILSLKSVSIDVSGILRDDNRGAVKGVTVEFQRPNQTRAKVTYLQFNLSDERMGGVPSMRTNPEFEKFLTSQPFDTAFYKAASFVSHLPSISKWNRIVQSKVRLLIQADDGIPVRELNAFSASQGGVWSVNLYGVYTAPDEIFHVNPQADARAMFAQAICASREKTRNYAANLWQKVWKVEACRESTSKLPESLAQKANWKGFIPVRFGYAAVSGPGGIVPSNDMSVFGNLIVLER